MQTTARSQSEIDDLLNDAQEYTDQGDTKFPGMTYEEGITNAIRWVMGDQDDNPMDD